MTKKSVKFLHRNHVEFLTVNTENFKYLKTIEIFHSSACLIDLGRSR